MLEIPLSIQHKTNNPKSKQTLHVTLFLYPTPKNMISLHSRELFRSQIVFHLFKFKLSMNIDVCFMAGHVLRHRALWLIPNRQNSSQTFSGIGEWECIEIVFEAKDTVRGSLTVDNLLMAMCGGLVQTLAANEER